MRGFNQLNCMSRLRVLTNYVSFSEVEGVSFQSTLKGVMTAHSEWSVEGISIRLGHTVAVPQIKVKIS